MKYVRREGLIVPISVLGRYADVLYCMFMYLMFCREGTVSKIWYLYAGIKE